MTPWRANFSVTFITRNNFKGIEIEIPKVGGGRVRN